MARQLADMLGIGSNEVQSGAPSTAQDLVLGSQFSGALPAHAATRNLESMGGDDLSAFTTNKGFMDKVSGNPIANPASAKARSTAPTKSAWADG